MTTPTQRYPPQKKQSGIQYHTYIDIEALILKLELSHCQWLLAILDVEGQGVLLLVMLLH